MNLHEAINTYNTGDVTWGAATVADHEDRITYQLRLRGGIDVDINRHKDAIKKITAADATCLDDIDMEEAA